MQKAKRRSSPVARKTARRTKAPRSKPRGSNGGPKLPRKVKLKPPVLRQLKEISVVVKFLESSSLHWHRQSAGKLTPQGIPTVESRVAAAKAMILREVKESIENQEHLEFEWEEDDEG
jgi:hypothetical protein